MRLATQSRIVELFVGDNSFWISFHHTFKYTQV